MAGERTQEKRIKHPAMSKPAASFTFGAWPCGCSPVWWQKEGTLWGPVILCHWMCLRNWRGFGSSSFMWRGRSHMSPSPDSDPARQDAQPPRCETPWEAGTQGGLSTRRRFISGPRSQDHWTAASSFRHRGSGPPRSLQGLWDVFLLPSVVCCGDNSGFACWRGRAWPCHSPTSRRK